MWKRRLIAFLLVSMLVRDAAADVVIDWNNVLLDTIRTQSVNPPMASLRFGDDARRGV